MVINQHKAIRKKKEVLIRTLKLKCSTSGCKKISVAFLFAKPYCQDCFCKILKKDVKVRRCKKK
jgi:hypothetical protein